MKNVVNNVYTNCKRENETNNKTPGFYQVIMHNDDFTPLEFVVEILQRIFFMDRCKATDTVFAARENGKAGCGVYSKDVATSKISVALDYAKLNEHPLLLTLEAAR